MRYKLLPKPIYHVLLIGLLLLYFIFWWFYKLDVLPGLHGDEAWVGLKAHEYQSQPLDRLSGMTYYTGVLQSLTAEVSFKLFGLGVYQLRVPSSIINLIALIIIVGTFLAYRFYWEAGYFLLILGASSLYLISARIAWEVNTFTLFFIAILLAPLLKLYQSDKRLNVFWVCLFWLTNIVGSYNHIIFSAISVAFFLGMLWWGIQRGAFLDIKTLILAGINCLNVVIVYLILRYDLNYFYLHIVNLPLYLGGLILLEYLAYYKLPHITIKTGFVTRRFNYLVISLLFITFVYYHGKGFFDVLSSYKFIIQAYSYECSFIIQVIFLIGAALFCFVSAKVLLQDFTVKRGNNTICAFVIVSYLGLLSLYTTKNSLRYYLVLYAVLCIYLAFKLNLKDKITKLFIGCQLVVIALINIILLDIFIHCPVPVKAVDFEIGNSQKETSSAFLPKKPLIDFLKDNHISKIDYIDYPYFIEQPIKFYKLFSPWKESKKDSAAIGYDYSIYKNGYLLIKMR